MIAASKQYPFGTKVYIPGFGLGEVHDRGGAIVGTCRLDIWLGWGDLGLSRALAWGKRTVVSRVFLPGRPVPEELQQKATLLQSPPATRTLTGDPVAKPYYSADLTMGDTGEKVKALEEDLKKLGYLTGPVDETYDLATAQAVFAFQKSRDIVRSEDSYGAGYFGYQTRRALSRWRAGSEVITKAKEPASDGPKLSNLLRVISKGERSPEVRHAQELLSQLGYYTGEISGVYGDQTRSAVLRFQQANKIVVAETDLGAGTIGPVTVKKLMERASVVSARTKTYVRGDRNDLISEVQGQLVSLGRLEPDMHTGFFGAMTDAAVKAFQIEQGLVGGVKDPNYGRLGPVTIAAIARAKSEQSLQTVALKRGDRGQAVKEVQTLLVRVGYQLPAVSGFFGPATEDAVRAFQKRTRLIRVDTDLGAGMVGPVTKSALVAAASERVAIAGADDAGANVAPSEPE